MRHTHASAGPGCRLASRRPRILRAPATLSLALLMAPAAQATEGASTYQAGVENFMTGAAPPPGFHLLSYLNVYSADTLRDATGQARPVPGFQLDATALATRVVWSSPIPVMGGNLLMHAIVPLVDLKISAGGQSQRKTGLGDITFGPAIAFHHSPSLHSVLALDLLAPTGRYAQADMTNLGANHWSIQPVYTVTRIDPAGWNADFKATLNINRRNSATDYRSGTELCIDYAVGWGLGHGWTLGVGGYLMRQLTDDTQHGASVADSRSRAAAIGPSVRYDNGRGWFITAKFTSESGVRNRPDGNALWVKAVVPF